MSWTDGTKFKGQYKMGEYEYGSFFNKKGTKMKVGGSTSASISWF